MSVCLYNWFNYTRETGSMEEDYLLSDDDECMFLIFISGYVEFSWLCVLWCKICVFYWIKYTNYHIFFGGYTYITTRLTFLKTYKTPLPLVGSTSDMWVQFFRLIWISKCAQMWMEKVLKLSVFHRANCSYLTVVHLSNCRLVWSSFCGQNSCSSGTYSDPMMVTWVCFGRGLKRREGEGRKVVYFTYILCETDSVPKCLLETFWNRYDTSFGIYFC